VPTVLRECTKDKTVVTEFGWLILYGSVPKHPKLEIHWAIIEKSGSLLNATDCEWSVVVQVRLHTSFSNGSSQDVNDKAKKET
jgi:hypothetical protein